MPQRLTNNLTGLGVVPFFGHNNVFGGHRCHFLQLIFVKG